MDSKASVEDDSVPVTQDAIDDEDNLSDMDSHTGSERDAVSEAGSETPSVSDRSSLRNSRSASNTPTNTRSTRSRDNPDFVAKQKSFMAKVQAATTGIDSPMMRPDTPGKRKRDNSASSSQGSTKKRKYGKNDNNGQDYQNDNYCWECHREGVFICCEMCPRVFHLKCAGMDKEPEEDWACSECHAVMQAENIENRSRAMQLISVEQLCTLLKFALNRLKTMPGMEPFTKPVDTAEFPTYEDVVVHPVDFTSLERNIKRKFYGSTEAFSSDARWIVHNSVIFNGANSKVTSMARSLVKILKQDMSEIETCPDCYMNAHQKPKTWFIEACRSAHPLIWARLKGFPFWPAKAVKWRDGNVDVRFFGRHDRKGEIRSWVPVKECFLFSEQMPTPLKNRNKTLESCLQEVNEHIVKLRERFGRFKYAPHRVQFNPLDADQIKIMLPNYKTPVPVRVRSQSRAFSRLSGHSDDETSSVASTDSGASVRRRKRESGTSSATQETETEAEIPSQTSDHGDEDNMEEGNESAKKEEKPLADPEIKKETKDEDELEDLPDRGEDEEDKFKDEIDTKPEIEDGGDEFDEYPVGNFEDDDEDNEEGDEMALVNGKPSEIKSVIEKVDESAVKKETVSDDEEKPSNIEEVVKRDRKSPESSEKENTDVSAGQFEKNEGLDDSDKEDGESEDEEEEEDEEDEEEEVEEEEEGLGNLVLSTEGEDAYEDEETSEKMGAEEYERKEKNEEKLVEELLKSRTDGKADKDVSENRIIDNVVENVKESNTDELQSESLDRQTQGAHDIHVSSLQEKLLDILKKDEGAELSDSEDGAHKALKDKPRIATPLQENFKEKDEMSSPENQSEESDVDEEDMDKSLTFKDSNENVESESDSDECESELKNSVKETKSLVEKIDSENESHCKENKGAHTNSLDSKESEAKEAKLLVNIDKSSPERTDEKVSISRDLKETVQNKLTRECGKSATVNEYESVHKEASSVCDVESMDIDEYSVNKKEGKKQEVDGRAEDEKMEVEDSASSKSTLLDAVQLMKNMGTIAITRVDGKTLDHGCGNAKEKERAEGNDDKKSSSDDSNRNTPNSRRPSPAPRVSEKDMEQHISSLGCSVSVTKAVDKDREKEKEKEKEKVKMPSGVDTTRLSPSISIIPVASAAERQRTKTTIAPSTSSNESQNSPTISTQSAPRTSPAVSQNPSSTSTSSISEATPSTAAQSAPQRVSSASSSSSPHTAGGNNIPPPPPLSHPQASQSNVVGPRGVFGPPPPGSQVLGMPGARGPIMSSPGLRMMTSSGPGVLIPSRMPGGPGMTPTRHLPPEAGPLSSQLHKHSQKLAEVMRATLEDVLAGLVGTGTPEARLAALQLELERTSWRHQQELAEVRHNADVMLVEMRANLEAEKQRAVEEVRRQMEQQMVEARRQMERQMVERLAEVRRQMEAEKQRAVEETKKKQWCANCGKEALFFCCWNTSYCDYPCQQSHWPQHMAVCGQNSDSGGGEGGPDSVNGEASGHSSRVSTPQNLVVTQQYVDEEGAVALAEEHRRRKQRENPSPLYGDMALMNRGSPAGGVPGAMNANAGVPTGSPNMAALSPGSRAGMANLGGPAMAAMAAMAAGSAGAQSGHSGVHGGMKMPRYMPPNILQQQQMYGGVDPRMMMMMGRGMPPGAAAAAMMRSPMHHFRPRFM
ncbi:protein kinase C-binding protein 1-like isoform X3 [Penaeus chinensis]|uniref:protein kinase C-binding protein 1-like isoform X3 n=1 Tax=Penaeus chinensis TaxID=139456 RepID=UPI001FB5B57E|nr:protein kinase C-binding protein 1-like isoform X3 [Penaeus chinensis]